MQAAGGVVWRTARGDTEVLVVHRPKYDDWSLPKGKLDEGETHEDAARREVEEETGLQVRLDHEVGKTSYHDRYGRPKAVRYWAMTPVAGSFTPSHEVDEVRWLPLGEAKDLLTYAHDRRLLDRFAHDAEETVQT